MMRFTLQKVPSEPYLSFSWSSTEAVLFLSPQGTVCSSIENRPVDDLQLP